MYLNCKTYFSLRYGTLSSEALVKAGAEAGATTMALTNINSTTDLWDFVQDCRNMGIKPIAGVEIRNGNKLLYILLAASNKGLEWINRFLTKHLQEAAPFPEKALQAPFFDAPSDGFVLYPPGVKDIEALFVNERIALAIRELNKLYSYPVSMCKDKLVLRLSISFQDKLHYNLHRLLRAIDNNVLLSRLDPAELAHPDEYFLPNEKIWEACKRYPFLISNTLQLAEACSVEMDYGKDKNKKTFTASADDDRALLAKLARDGCRQRYGDGHKEAAARIEKELKIIDQLGFSAYFLITWDMIRYARSKGYYYVGRGSGANSMVAYCLQITDVDPVELDLYFERFLNPYRSSPPDFDIDFSWLDRDDVIDYMFKRYGKDHVCLLGMVDTFQYKAAVRELGKVFGLPKAEIDRLAASTYYNGESRSEGFSKRLPENNIEKIILQYGRLLQNFPNHLSIHPGGILISEAPLTAYTAVHMPPKGFPTSQIDMFVAEQIGLYKLDVLSQRGLGHIKETLRLVKENRGKDINIHNIEAFKKDERVRSQIRRVDTIGCFYIESPAMRHLLKKLECDDYLTLVAASSIIRPGVGRSGMMQQYIFRYHHPDSFQYLHPKLESLLKETYGVMVYQEDVIKVAHHFAGLDMGEADMLRRAMSGKYRGHDKFNAIKEKFFSNCSEFGYTESVAQELWRQIESFGSYSFSKAHSASFAVESYQSLFLKAYFPMEFMVAVINNFGGFYSTELYFYELMKTGADVHPPCINQSEYLTNIYDKQVYVGFIHIKGLDQKEAENMVAERNKRGRYADLSDFIERTAITPESLNLLIRTGALRFTGRSKKQLLWEANFLHKKTHTSGVAGTRLFKEAVPTFSLPELPVYALDDLYDEVELLGFPLRDPFMLVDDDPDNYIYATDIPKYKGQTITLLGYHITQKPVRTVKGETMSFGTFIDQRKDWIDTVHFPDVYRKAPPQAGFFRIRGKVVEEFAVYSIEVTHIEKVGLKRRNHKMLRS